MNRLLRGHPLRAAALPGYVRYIDDFTLWAGEKAVLREWRDAVVGFAADTLGLDSSHHTSGAPGMGWIFSAIA